MTKNVGAAPGRYRALASSLTETADATAKFLREELGLTGLRIEEAIHPRVSYRPTLHAQNREHSIICVEVSDTAYPPSLDQLVLDCKNLSLPAKIYVAMPTSAEDSAYKENTIRAHRSGVGLIQVDGSGGN